MNYYFFDRKSYNLYYNCSYYSIDLYHPLEERTNIVYGIFLVIIGLMFIIFYIPIIIVLWQPKFQKESCFRIMSYIAIIDLFAINVGGIITGYFSFKGLVYCSSPWLMMISGSICYAAWIAESDLAVLLAINRLLFFTKPHLCNSFSNSRNQTLLYFLAVLAHAFIVQISTDVLTFNSIYGAYFFNPHHGFPEPNYKFINVWHPIQNIGVALLLAIIYLIFLIYFIKQKVNNSNGNGQSNNPLTISDAPIFLQVLIVSLLNFFTALAYVYFQHYPMPDIAVKITHVAWLFIHGLPSVLYISLNKSIRIAVLKLITPPKDIAPASSMWPLSAPQNQLPSQ